MRDEKEERKKQTNKQGKATQHTQGSHFIFDVKKFTSKITNWQRNYREGEGREDGRMRRV